MNKKKSTIVLDRFFLVFLQGKKPFLWLAIISFLVYCRSIAFGFSPLDDYMLIVKRLDWLLTGPLSEIFTKGVFKTDGGSDYYRPLLVLTFITDAWIAKGQPWMFHLTNILLHCLATIMLYLFLKEFISDKKSFVFALLFAAHPVLVHAVAWIPGRNDSLLAIFSLASMIFLLRYMRQKKFVFLLFHLFFFICVLFTKESSLLMPFLFISFYLMFSENKKRTNFILLTILWLSVTTGWWILKNEIVPTQADLSLFDLKRVFVDFLFAMIIQTGKSVLPVQQAILPDIADTSLIPGMGIIVIVAVLAIRNHLKDKRIAFFGLGWFVIFLVLPTLLSAFDRVGIQYEHRLYVPMAGIFLFLSQLKLRKIKWQNSIICLVLLFFIIKTNVRSEVYRNSFKFSFAAAEESPSSAVALNLLGNEYHNLKNYRQAIQCYSRSFDLDSMKYPALFNRGNSYLALGEIQLALADYNKGLKNDSLNAKGYFDRGNIYFDLGKFDSAILDYNKAISIYPGYSNAHNNRGNAWVKLKNYKNALSNYNQAIFLRPNNANAYNNRGNLYTEMGETEKALADFNAALSKKPTDKDYLNNRNFIIQQLNRKNHSANNKVRFTPEEEAMLVNAYQLYKQKNYLQAISVFEKLASVARQKNDRFSEFSHRNNIGLCYIKTGNYVLAEKILKSILFEDPGNTKAQSNLRLLDKTQKH